MASSVKFAVRIGLFTMWQVLGKATKPFINPQFLRESIKKAFNE
jgi:hypothetical protein